MSTMRLVQIIKQNPKNIQLSNDELQNKCIEVMKDKGHIGEGKEYWDFYDKNRWALSHVMGNKDSIICGCFEAGHNFKFKAYLCRKCEGIFQLPFETNKCMFCGHSEIEKENRTIRVRELTGRAGLTDGVNPDLYAAAVKDIQEHGTPQSNEPEYDLDWDYLENNV